MIDIEYMPEFPYNDEESFSPKKTEAFLKIMESDSSGANVHAVFTNYCGGGWAEGIGRLCKDTPIAFNCMINCLSPKCMSGIVTHEIGHILGKTNFSFYSTSLKIKFSTTSYQEWIMILT